MALIPQRRLSNYIYQNCNTYLTAAHNRVTMKPTHGLRLPPHELTQSVSEVIFQN